MKKRQNEISRLRLKECKFCHGPTRFGRLCADNFGVVFACDFWRMLIDSGLGETLHFRVFARSLIDLSIMSFLIFDAFDVLKKRIPL